MGFNFQLTKLGYSMKIMKFGLSKYGCTVRLLK
ncbi:MAG: hypothetical protein ACI88Z_001840, partial [Sphingobacteriales bacterium]